MPHKGNPLNCRKCQIYKLSKSIFINCRKQLSSKNLKQSKITIFQKLTFFENKTGLRQSYDFEAGLWLYKKLYRCGTQRLGGVPNTSFLFCTSHSYLLSVILLYKCYSLYNKANHLGDLNKIHFFKFTFIGSKLEIQSFLELGTFVGSMLKMINFFRYSNKTILSGIDNIVDIFNFQKTFLIIFSNI